MTIDGNMTRNYLRPVLFASIKKRAPFLFYIIAVLLIELVPFTVNAQPFLSNLSASVDQPLYLTYAAALQRSGYILDQGYRFNCFEPAEGIYFNTDRGGSLNIAFKLNDSLCYSRKDYFKTPVITTSYSDLVRYYYYPFYGIRADVSFLVYSSRIALQEINLTNERLSSVSIDLYPFSSNTSNGFSSAAIINGQTGFTYRHVVSADSWVTDHGIPHIAKRANVFLMDTAAVSFGAYTGIGNSGKSAEIKNKRLQNYCVEYGLVHHNDGSLCTHSSSSVRQIVILNKNKKQILTENAPKWGDTDPNVPGNGYQGCELGNFSAPSIAVGDSFTVIFSCETTHEHGQSTGVVTKLPADGGINVPIQLKPAIVPTPLNLNVQFSSFNIAALVKWDYVSPHQYSLCRRSSATQGIFDVIASEITNGSYLDSGLDSSLSYMYTIFPATVSGTIGGHSLEIGRGSSFLFQELHNAMLSNTIPNETVKALALQRSLTLPPGGSRSMRIVAGVSDADSAVSSLVKQCSDALSLKIDTYQTEDEITYSKIPDLKQLDPKTKMLYWNSFTLMRQCMLPPEGKSNYNYYVFSREPQWGWGHGGQVFHESLCMLAYALMDPVSAQNSQRVFMECQHEDGYINYRTGPYLDETIATNGQLTTSAPWFSWTNLELYKISGDKKFLEDSYTSGKKLFGFFENNRDSDHDGLYEWGGHAVLESVRDGEVAVWDNVGWPAKFECMDLSSMLYCEAQSLSKMAAVLGQSAESDLWKNKAAAIRDSINKYMWDEKSGFYYNVTKANHTFSQTNADDLKRKEIIGFLPLWAGIASPQQASKIVAHLLDSSEFWRAYGVPSLAANDPYYNPQGYWNGPVWVQWQYLIFRGLLNYGYQKEARQLAEKVLANMTYSLETNHYFWELYSPDTHWSGWNKTYIWAGIVARMLNDVDTLTTGVEINSSDRYPLSFALEQNYPNPFNPVTTIRFDVPVESKVVLKVFDALGRNIATLVNEAKEAGTYDVKFDASQYSSGIYFYSIQSGSYRSVKKMVYLR